MIDRKRLYGFGVCAAAYVVAALAAVGCWWGMQGTHPIVVAAAADALATVVVFGFSRLTNNSSIYDPYWSVAPLVILPYFAFGPWAAAADDTRVLVTLAVVFAWGIRLTYNWARRWRGLEDEDFRYVELRKKHGSRYWVVSFLGIHFFPTVLVFLGCLPLYYAATSPAPFGVLDAFGVAIGVAAIWCEAAADKQLRKFAQTPHEPKAILASGLWRHSRHPNYFGEILFWWAVLALGLGANPLSVWTAVGALAITGLFKFVSVPLLDTRMLEKRPHYAEHMQRTNAIVPWPKRP